MKALRAILLLIVYTAFTATTSFARHSCTENCTSQVVEHGSHSDTGVPPTECTEKEAVNNQPVEHRSCTAVKVLVAANRNTPQLTRQTPAFLDQAQDLNKGLKIVNLPLYISHCVYRL